MKLIGSGGKNMDCPFYGGRMEDCYLESNSFLGHKAYGNTYQYYPAVSRTDYGKSRLSGIITSCFDDSYMSAVSSFVREEKISVEELKALVEQIEKGRL